MDTSSKRSTNANISDYSRPNSLRSSNNESSSSIAIISRRKTQRIVGRNYDNCNLSTSTSTANQTTSPGVNLPSSSSLTLKLAGDVTVGTGVTFLMSPFLSVVDKAISQRASGTHTLLQSSIQSLQSMIRNPIAYAKNPTFLYVWAVYAATYSTANGLKTIVEHQSNPPLRRSQTNSKLQQGQTKQTTASSSFYIDPDVGKLGIFLGTSLANSGASVLKDRAFAYMFAANASSSSLPQKVPAASYAVWLSRDLIGVGSSFVLPDLLAKKFTDNAVDYEKYRDLSQLCVPVATQLVAGPLHLLGLDLFNRPMHDLSWKGAILERSKFLMNGYAAVVGARVMRIIPGYGFGGVLNSRFRDSWREYLVQTDSERSTIFQNHENYPLPERLSRIFAVMRNNVVDTISIEN